VKLWDVATGEECAVIKGHAGQVSSLAFSPDGKLLAAGVGTFSKPQGEVVLWEVERTSAGGSSRRHVTLKGHPGSAPAIVFASVGRVLATTASGTVRLWNADTGQELLVLERAGGNLAFSPDGKTLATTSSTGIKVWDISSTHAR
jgi:WD40 repeat protein